MRAVLPWGAFLAAFMAAATPGTAQQPTAAQTPPPPPAVKVGDVAPDFKLPYRVSTKPGGPTERKEASLAEFRGKKNVVLAFFVAAFSPG